MKNKYISITIVSFIIGFMLFVQYNTVQNPTIRDTKNIWEIRNELSEELKTHSQLLKAIGNVQVIYEFANLRTQPNLEKDELWSKDKIT